MKDALKFKLSSVLKADMLATNSMLNMEYSELPVPQAVLTHDTTLFSDMYKSDADIAAPPPPAPAEPHFAQPISVGLAALYNKINSVIAGVDLTDKFVALKLIHRYNTTDNLWYITAECGTIPQEGNYEVGARAYKHDYTALPGRFDITNDTLTDNVGFNTEHCPDYFDNINVNNAAHGTPAVYEPLVITEHVKNVIFPWECELVRLFNENGFPAPDTAPANIKVVFLPTLRLPPHDPRSSITLPQSSVIWPHQVAIHLDDILSISNPFLDNDSHKGAIFKHKAANYSTLCPPRCPVSSSYYWPVSLEKCV